MVVKLGLYNLNLKTYVFDLSFISSTSGWATAFLPDKQGELLRFN